MKRGKLNKFWFIVLIISIVVFIICSAFIIKYFWGDGINFKKFTSTTISETDSATKVELPDNPINFGELKAINTDVYAWIKIPNTNVDYPVAQSYSEDDSYYLKHNIYKKYDSLGTIYSEKQNALDFSDPNTVLYGHNTYSGAMFRTLYKFKDANFFKNNKYIYIYTPGHILTYEIFSAYRYDDTHILNSFDFSDKNVFKEYLKYATNPPSMVVNVRKETKVTENDRILTLSTCMAGQREYRYLVQGVLINDELTK